MFVFVRERVLVCECGRVRVGEFVCVSMYACVLVCACDLRVGVRVCVCVCV